jgi:adenylate kinase family enzyme
MSEIDDAQDFVNASSSYTQPTSKNRNHTNPSSLRDFMDALDDEDTVKPGQPTQYSLYSTGYVSTTPTISRLPAGCYNIVHDNKCVFAEPAAKPAGLLLELPEMRSEEVIKVVENFWNSEKDYKEGNEFVIGGAAYRAGSLLYGPPGSGKSSTIKIAALRMVKRDGIVFYSALDAGSISSFLSDFSKIEPGRKCVVVLEDLDSLIERYGEAGYLEMLDSAKTIDNVFFIATTNYPEKLDPRIYNRPGRFSHVIKIGLPTEVTRRAYLKAILKNHQDIDYIVENSKGFTVDHLSSLLNAVYREKKNLETEIKRLRVLFKVPISEEKSLGFGLNEEEDEL